MEHASVLFSRQHEGNYEHHSNCYVGANRIPIGGSDVLERAIRAGNGDGARGTVELAAFCGL
jgi:hypothetical protein